MGGPGQVIGDLETKNPEALDPFHFVPFDGDRGMFSSPLSEVNDNLRFVDSEGEMREMSNEKILCGSRPQGEVRTKSENDYTTE